MKCTLKKFTFVNASVCVHLFYNGSIVERLMTTTKFPFIGVSYESQCCSGCTTIIADIPIFLLMLGMCLQRIYVRSFCEITSRAMRLSIFVIVSCICSKHLCTCILLYNFVFVFALIPFLSV